MSIWPQVMPNRRPSSDGRAGHAGDGVLRRRVRDREGSRHLSGDRAVVHDAAALRVLGAHDPERGTGAEERAGHVEVDDLAPLVDVDLVDLDRAAAAARVVEQQVEAAEPLHDRVEDLVDRFRVGDIAGERVDPLRPLREFLSGSARRPTTATVQPAPASAVAQAAPIPVPPPVTIAMLVPWPSEADRGAPPPAGTLARRVAGRSSAAGPPRDRARPGRSPRPRRRRRAAAAPCAPSA